ncbi:MAG: zf-TFIIB domain-containing protein [Planctomycetes bacterium]|nr:zf-TFIIB domain-containing protein [Planctomycetota bacterium]
MACPGCAATLRAVEHAGLQLDVCACGGIWFDRGELGRWLEQNGMRHSVPAAGELATEEGNRRRCPRCATATLHRFVAGELRGSGCRTCEGIWLTAIDVRRARGLRPSPASAGSSVAWSLADLIGSVLQGLWLL